MDEQIKYEGSAYIGVVGPDMIPGQASLSIAKIVRRDGDAAPVFHFATKGYEARQMHVDTFMASDHSWILLLDSDMIFEPHTLERLRSHELPFVTGLYMRRRIQPLMPVWFHPYSGAWPMEPFMDRIERPRLYRLGASGWGCMLIHRAVIEATKPILKGEHEILEDDMDVWPYDLARVMALTAELERATHEPMTDAIRNGIKHLSSELRREFKPLRARRDIVGSDIRYPFYAMHAGFQLVGDTEVRPSHVLNYALTPDDWDQVPHEHWVRSRAELQLNTLEDREVFRRNMAALGVTS